MTERPSISKFMDEKASEELHMLLRGHLYLEWMLAEILRRKMSNPESLAALNMGFYKLVKLHEAMGLLDQAEVELLLALNRLRNRYAHRLGFDLTFDNAFELAELAGKACVDFSDETIYIDKSLSKEWYGTYGALHEVIRNTFDHLFWKHHGSIFTNADTDLI